MKLREDDKRGEERGRRKGKKEGREENRKGRMTEEGILGGG